LNAIGAHQSVKQGGMATAKRIGLGIGKSWPKVMLGLGLIAVLAIWLFREPVMSQAIAGTAYGARVGCSCRYVGGRDLEDCLKDYEPGMEIVSLSEDPEAKSVTASVPLLASQTARFREGYGCVLDPWEE
jgi:hypothetical protein